MKNDVILPVSSNYVAKTSFLNDKDIHILQTLKFNYLYECFTINSAIFYPPLKTTLRSISTTSLPFCTFYDFLLIFTLTMQIAKIVCQMRESDNIKIDSLHGHVHSVEKTTSISTAFWSLD